MSYEIRQLTFEDWEEIKEIYLQGIETGHATFQTEAPSKEAWFEEHISACSLGYFDNKELLAWAALSRISSRCVYAGVAEVSIYIKENARGRGIGTALFKKLIEVSEEEGYWTLQSGIFPENMGSIRLHQKNGFREVGRREKIGEMNGVWRDVLLFERRSNKVGQD